MKPFHILICEQNPDHAELLAYNLKKAGFRPTIFTSDEILDHALKTKPQMIILGSNADDKEKARLSKKIKKKSSLSQTLVVCLTTNDGSSMIKSPKKYAMDACITLPQKPKKIIKIVEKLFAKQAEAKASK